MTLTRQDKKTIYMNGYDRTEVAPMKEAVSSPAVASCVNKLFVIGGGPDDNTCSDKVRVAQLSTTKTSQRTAQMIQTAIFNLQSKLMTQIQITVTAWRTS